MQGQRLKDLVELFGTFDLKYADVGPLADNAPEMEPFAFALQFRGAFMLKGAEPLDLLWIDSPRGSVGHSDME